MKNNIDKVAYLCSMILQGVRDNDKDSVRFHLEDLNYFIQENKLEAD